MSAPLRTLRAARDEAARSLAVARTSHTHLVVSCNTKLSASAEAVKMQERTVAEYDDAIALIDGPVIVAEYLSGETG